MPHAPMRAGFAGVVAASILGASAGLPVAGGVEEQAVTINAVASAADAAVPTATKGFDMESVSLRGVPDGHRPIRAVAVYRRGDVRILRGLPRHAPDGYGKQNPTCDQRQSAERREHVDETRCS